MSNLTSSWTIVGPEVLHILISGMLSRFLFWNPINFMRSFLSLFTSLWMIHAFSTDTNYSSEQRPTSLFTSNRSGASGNQPIVFIHWHHWNCYRYPLSLGEAHWLSASFLFSIFKLCQFHSFPHVSFAENKNLLTYTVTISSDSWTVQKEIVRI